MKPQSRHPVSRRSTLKGAATLAVLGAVPLGWPSRAFAARERVVARMERDIQNLDPAFRTSTVEANILRAVQQRLVRFKPGSFEWEPDAAESIRQVSPTVIEFALRPGQAFTGGYGELTAEDVKFSFERFNNPPPGQKKASYASDWAQLEAVEVTGPLTGRILLKKPAPALWLTALADASGCLVSRRAFEQMGEKVNTHAVGSGPYLQAEWTAEQRYLLGANPDYRGSMPARFKEIALRPVQDGKAAEIAFRAGELDFTRIDVTSVEEFRKLKEARLSTIDAIDYIWIGLNVEKPPLDDLRVRRAIRLAIDVDAALTAAYDGKVKRANAVIPPQLLGHWAEAPVHRRDVAAARRLLAEAGHANGIKVTLTCLNQPAYRTAALVAQANLAEAGVQCEVRALDGGSYWSAGAGEAGAQLELSLQLFKGKADPSFYTQWFTAAQVGEWNWQRWKSPEYDALHEQAASTLDAAERTKAFVRMQQLMDESAAFVWLTHDALVFAAQAWLKPAVLPNGNDWQLAYFAEA
jgi:peptide/nickel transport system substrate-binding protein